MPACCYSPKWPLSVAPGTTWTTSLNLQMTQQRWASSAMMTNDPAARLSSSSSGVTTTCHWISTITNRSPLTPGGSTRSINHPIIGNTMESMRSSHHWGLHTTAVPTVLTTFYRGTVERSLTTSLSVWNSSCTAADQKSLQRLVRTAESSGPPSHLYSNYICHTALI